MWNFTVIEIFRNVQLAFNGILHTERKLLAGVADNIVDINGTCHQIQGNHEKRVQSRFCNTKDFAIFYFATDYSSIFVDTT